MFNIRLREYTPAGVKGRVISTLSLDLTVQDSATAGLQFSMSRRVADGLALPAVVGVEYSTGGRYVTPRNNLFIVPDDETNFRDRGRVVTYRAENLVSWLLARADVGWSDTAIDGAREFHEATPGTLMATLVNGAKGRGWGPHVTVDFTGATDSNGQAWPADSKFTGLIPMTDKLSQVLEMLSSQGLCEWWTEGFKLRMVKSGTGTDASAIALGGPSFTEAPDRSSFNEVFTHLTVVSDQFPEWVTLTNAGADSRFGRLEATMSQSGIEDVATATKLAQPAMNAGRTMRYEHSFDWDTTNLVYPFHHFNVGDTVTVRTRQGRRVERVVSIVVSKTDKTVTVRAVTGSAFSTLTAKLIKRTGSATVGGIIGGTGGGIPNAKPPMSQTPSIPANVRVTANEGAFRPTGSAMSIVTLEWDAVTTATDGSAAVVTQYEVWSQLPGAAYVRDGATATPTATFTNWLPGVGRFVQIRARTQAGAWSDFSEPITVIPAWPSSVVAKPTVPIITSDLSMVMARWDGLFDIGAPSAWFDKVVMETAPDPVNGPWVPSGAPLHEAGSNNIRGIVGDSVHVRFVAYDTMGRITGISDVATIIVKGLVPGDVDSIPSFWTDEAWINAATVNVLRAGVIETYMVSAAFGQNLDITSNESVTIIAGTVDEHTSQIGDMQGAVDAAQSAANDAADLAGVANGTASDAQIYAQEAAAAAEAAADAIAQHQTVYRFGTKSATISTPGSNQELELASGYIQMKQNGVVLTRWEGGQMIVSQMVVDAANIGAHRFEKYSNGRTTVRPL